MHLHSVLNLFSLFAQDSTNMVRTSHLWLHGGQLLNAGSTNGGGMLIIYCHAVLRFFFFFFRSL